MYSLKLSCSTAFSPTIVYESSSNFEANNIPVLVYARSSGKWKKSSYPVAMVYPSPVSIHSGTARPTGTLSTRSILSGRVRSFTTTLTLGVRSSAVTKTKVKPQANIPRRSCVLRYMTTQHSIPIVSAIQRTLLQPPEFSRAATAFNPIAIISPLLTTQISSPIISHRNHN